LLIGCGSVPGQQSFLGECFRRVASSSATWRDASSDDSRRLSVPARDSTSLDVDRAFSSPRQPKRVASLSEAWHSCQSRPCDLPTHGGRSWRQRSIVVACDFSVKLCATRFPLPTQRFTANPALGRPLLKRPERPTRAPVLLRDKAISEGIEGLTASAPPASAGLSLKGRLANSAQRAFR
jgi:hypothetical protein